MYTDFLMLLCAKKTQFGLDVRFVQIVSRVIEKKWTL